jgi:16S rRNA (cytosine967-C5)-methyltransferase
VGFGKPREIAARVLVEAERDGQYVERLLDRSLARSPLSAPDRALARELVLGVTRWRATLDWLIAMKTGGRPQIPAVRMLLRLGLYQMLWLDRIPDHAAIFETVESARRLGFQNQCGFLNGVLRSAQRERDALATQLEKLKTDDPALGWSHPALLVDRWRRRLPPDALRNLLEWDNTPAHVFARCNELRTDPGSLLARWREENVRYDFGRWDWIGENQCFEIRSERPIAQLDSFLTGGFYIQDPGTFLAPSRVGARPGETVLDLCAAPGGKTAMLAQAMQNKGTLVAHDDSAERLDLLRENARRLGLDCLVIEPDRARLERHAPFDRILIDAPCSNTGVLRRRVDARWRFSENELGALRTTQQSLLDAAARWLKPGGTLVYSTCSLESEENEQAVEEFLRRHPRFSVGSVRALTPHTDGVDGAFVAAMTFQPLPA